MRRTTLLLVAVACLLSVAPASAVTVEVEETWIRGSTSFSLGASNGYTVSVERRGRQVTLTALRLGGFLAAASYTVPGSASPDRIEARFGNKLGRVSVRFKAKQVKKIGPRKGCTGKPAMDRSGVFVGTITFRGEGGYTTVDARRAQGRVIDTLVERCEFPHTRRSARASASPLGPPAVGASLGDRRGFGASISRRAGKRSVFYEAISRERRGRMRIFRGVFAKGREDSFTYVGDLSAATVKPPAPFEGEAAFLRERRGKGSWLGPLSVSFPGRDDVPMAGSRFVAQLGPED
jgi:hypothetical protein